MIIKARHHIIVYPAMRLLTRFIVWRNFSRVLISGNHADKGLAVLVLANHFSWWDGFWIMYLNMKLFKRKFNFMMLEEQLSKYWFFRLSGGFSVRKGSRSIIESIGHAASLLENPGNLVLIFPQGRIKSLYDTRTDFERGVASVLGKLKNDIQIVFVANLVDWLSEPKPALSIYHREFKSGNAGKESIEAAYNEFFSECIEKNKSRALE
ncbi:MAG: lysophospholipid acyltransferase family protein [Bacteroidales bacterium]|jgi:1-acyl-sn-glycerol-3-phosphate acyltransferase|nr:lysophospholipid acyltransferase family protein [Bacteroidales bacterium]